ncbi:alpha/beta fold hydrolase [Flavobacterium sp. ASW18X]|uniref:alpha/beta fold hydrolase n=1 Tax=Flavobacterium sp. ASW18X TaxID=2572595 RepID=UPI0010AE8E4B|nr:alpha/beta fold hydrolase [Flavobacterium sp. ASW18X]TKD66690.1 alpha/beta fold hydrolase [Flavobacterium sp. ASW18X]
MEILHSNILGEGKPLLILHGFLGMSDNWKTLGSQFAEEGFLVHLIDQRNHGKSFHSDEFHYQALAEDIERYMNHHNISSASLIGHSMGGKTAMQFAVTHPEKVAELIVADIAPKFYPPHHQYIINGLKTLNFDELKSRKEADNALAESLKDWGIRQFLLKNLYWVEKGKLGFRFNFKVLQDRMEEIGENINSTDSFDGASLFLRGSKSEYILPNDYAVIKTHFPKATIKTVDNAGHWLHAENPKDFFNYAIEFLNR